MPSDINEAAFKKLYELAVLIADGKIKVTEVTHEQEMPQFPFGEKTLTITYY